MSVYPIECEGEINRCRVTIVYQRLAEANLINEQRLHYGATMVRPPTAEKRYGLQRLIPPSNNGFSVSVPYGMC